LLVSFAPDGSPIELYALLPERGEGEVVARAVPAGASILELGCGTGRVTRQLVRLGYRVTAVDESPEMLSRVDGAEKVCGRIEALDLGRRFDAVLLASNLITVPARKRRAFLQACRRHAEVVIIEGLPLGWRPQEGETQLGPVTSRLRIAQIEDGVAYGAVEYVAGSRNWQHEFAMRVFADQGELDAVLAEAGLRFDRWLDPEEGRWFVACSSRATYPGGPETQSDLGQCSGMFP
jgi:SAM-dependent methyltransferase